MFSKDSRGERRMPVDILLNKYIDGEPHTCRAVNISRGGVLLYKIFEPDVDHATTSRSSSSCRAPLASCASTGSSSPSTAGRAPTASASPA